MLSYLFTFVGVIKDSLEPAWNELERRAALISSSDFTSTPRVPLRFKFTGGDCTVREGAD